MDPEQSERQPRFQGDARFASRVAQALASSGMLSWDAVEAGLQVLLRILRADARVQAEFDRSRAEFFADPAAARGPAAELRHLEWFLLERPSHVLGAVPAQAWQAEWVAALPEALAELPASMRESLPGAFEVTARAGDDGLWVRDLFTQGEHPVAEARAGATLEVGDLLVGRLYPAGGGPFLLSPAMSVFRNPALLAAVRSDLREMRGVRRGVLRVQQLELERLFQGPGSEPLGQQEPGEVRARARARLMEQGLEAEEVDRLLGRVRSAATGADGRVVTDILNGLAMDTGVDLSAVRLVLVELWDSERRSLAGGSHGRGEDDRDAGLETRAALEAFDRGRAKGRDLEQLFRELARDLGVDDGEEGSAEEEQGTPDFPGVVGAMVEEFLWEIEREQGSERARSWGVLRELGNYGRDIGVLEELGRTRLLDFSARWVLDESGLRKSAEVEALLEALTAFCQWCEERHDLPLRRQFGETLDLLRASVPRHLLLRQHSTAGPGRGAYRVVRIDPGVALVKDDRGAQQAVDVTVSQSDHLREGDVVRLTVAGGRPALGATYPAELSALMS